MCNIPGDSGGKYIILGEERADIWWQTEHRVKDQHQNWIDNHTLLSVLSWKGLSEKRKK